MNPLGGSPVVLSNLIAVSERDAARLRQKIADHYGFVVTLQYAADLVAFIDTLQAGLSRQENKQ